MSYIFINHKGCRKEATNTTLLSQRSRVALAECGYCALAGRLKGGNCWGNGCFWQLWGGGWRNLFLQGLTRNFNVWATSPRDVMGISGNKMRPQEGHSDFISFCGKIKNSSKDHPTIAFQLSYPPGLLGLHFRQECCRVGRWWFRLSMGHTNSASPLLLLPFPSVLITFPPS